jgi:hypothetical protein
MGQGMLKLAPNQAVARWVKPFALEIGGNNSAASNAL